MHHIGMRGTDDGCFQLGQAKFETPSQIVATLQRTPIRIQGKVCTSSFQPEHTSPIPLGSQCLWARTIHSPPSIFNDFYCVHAYSCHKNTWFSSPSYMQPHALLMTNMSVSLQVLELKTPVTNPSTTDVGTRPLAANYPHPPPNAVSPPGLVPKGMARTVPPQSIIASSGDGPPVLKRSMTVPPKHSSFIAAGLGADTPPLQRRNTAVASTSATTDPRARTLPAKSKGPQAASAAHAMGAFDDSRFKTPHATAATGTSAPRQSSGTSATEVDTKKKKKSRKSKKDKNHSAGIDALASYKIVMS